MNKAIKSILVTGALLLVLAPTAFVHAEDGDDSSSESQQSSGLTEQQKKAQELQREIEKRRSEIEKHRAEVEAEARKKVAERASEIEKENTEKKKSPEERKKTCEERKTGLETKLKNLVKNAEKHQQRISLYLDAATKYVNDNTLGDEAVTSALLKAEDAKAKSAGSVAALKALSPTIDCTAGAVSSDVAQFKAAAEQARNDIKAYKDSVKSLLEVLEDLNEEAGEQE